MSKVLVIGDPHEPACRPGYRQFCEDIAEKYRCNKFLCIGDMIDYHAISRHEKQPEANDSLTEFEKAKRRIQKWGKSFPKLTVTEGNHDIRVARQAATVNIPQRFLKGYNELYDVEWEWVTDVVIDDVYYFHGTGTSGKFPAMTTMDKMLMSVVQGHVHAAAGLWWRTNPNRRLFGMNTGAGVDDQHIAMRYGEHYKTRSVMAAGVVLDGMPQHFVMPCGEGEKYHRSRFKNESI